MDIPEISLDEAQELQVAGSATFVDVRDRMSYEVAHIPGALHLDDSNVAEFVAEADKSQAVVVYCYHGHSSMGATAFFQDQGFAAVSSMTGGFTAWQSNGGPSERSTPASP